MPVCRTCERQRISGCCGGWRTWTGTFTFTPRGERIAALTPQLLDAGVKLVIDHFGNPSPAWGENSPGFQAALRALGSGRGWVKISAPYRSPACDHRALAARLLAEAGPDRLL